MPLTAGTRFGPFVVEAPLGAGGMGEVYRARDTRLDRDVALKVLPEGVATDPDRLARFGREAKTLAALNHPNIAHVYGVESLSTGSGQANALVMELVDGEDLAAIVARGAMPVVDVLPLARQIADALEAAHEKGIIHRDLKPANVMVTSDGTVKILDFGLAKALAPEGAAATADAMHSPTLTARATQLGVILGTAAYMSPEQARGKPVDRRADIWAFGVVIYEMLTGRRAFGGEEISDVMAAVLRQDVDWAALPDGIPPRLRRVLERCLDRDPRTRLRDIGEARVEIANIQTGAGEPTAGAVTPAPHLATREVIAWSVAGAALLAAAVGLLRPTHATTDAGVARLPLAAPANVDPTEISATVISPDGQKLLFLARSPEGRRQLWVRPLDAMEATALPDTDEAIEPFWSPDSRSVAFGAQGKLRRIDLGAARAQTLADAGRLNNGAWSPSGTIVYSPDFRTPLARVSATGGERKPATTLDTTRGEVGHRYPFFLPDGRHFLYAADHAGPWAIKVGALDSTETIELLDAYGPAIYAPPGWLIYVRNGNVVAQAFNVSRLELSRDPIPLLAVSTATGWQQGTRASVSGTGVLVVQNAQVYDYQLAWFERGGKPLGTLGPKRTVTLPELPRISPDGTRVVVQRFDPQAQNQDLWMGNLARGTFDRFTTNPKQDQLASWSRDGRSLFASRAGLYQLPLGGGEDRLLLDGTVFPGNQSPDGKWMFFMKRGETTRLDVWALSLGDGSGPVGKPRALLNSEFDEIQPEVSPNGHWIAYVSDLTGTEEVYVRPLTPDARVGEMIRISTGGARQPCWSRDGRELYFVSAPQGYASAQLTAVPVKAQTGTVEFGTAVPLFRAHMLPITTLIRDYDVSPDGRFLIGTATSDPRATPATAIFNWTAGLKQ